jgi:hypothetical protein
MAQSLPQADGVYGQQQLASGNSEFNALTFMIQQMLGRVNTATLVSVIAVHTTGRSGSVGFVDVQPLVNQTDGIGQATPHGTIYHLPYIRLQGGQNALVVDPHAGDVGLVVFCDHDISAIKESGNPSAVSPGSRRRFDMADGVYLGGWSPASALTCYVVIDDDGIKIEADAQKFEVHSKDLTETADGDVVRKAKTVDETVTGTYKITVPELSIIGNLSVSGIVHCEWQGSLIGVKYGGTGADLSATGGLDQVVCQLAPGAPFEVRSLGELPISILYSNATPVPETIGGVLEGETFVNQTVSQVFDRLFYPELFPALVAPSSTFALTESGYHEIGEVVATLHFSATFSRGTITPAYGTSGLRSGLPNTYKYTGTGLSNQTSTSLTDTETVSSYTVLTGAQNWTGAVAYDAGEQPKSSSGNDYNSPLAAGNTVAVTRTITGVYPWFATSVAIATLTKQALTSMSSSYVQVTMIAEDGVDKQKAAFPDGWSAITGVQFYNTVSSAWEWLGGSKANSLLLWDVTATTETIQGSVIDYDLYTNNSATIGSRQLRWYTT